MDIPSEFKGTIYAYLLKGGFLHFSIYEPRADDKYLYLGSKEVDIQFGDKRNEAADFLDAQIEKERQESAHRIAVMLDMKRQCLALEVQK